MCSRPCSDTQGPARDEEACAAYVGHRGWLGVRLDRGFDRDEIAAIIEDAYAEVAPSRLLKTD
ncbi:MAG TPA: hypothetical protein VGF72_01690 [Gaiellaceae bacterium]